ncbi:biotin--[acetyl-CoA-carboxylase] ligase [Candidatus Bipolaricaulota bacterium]
MEPNIHHIERTTSTQLDARRLIAQGEAKIGDIVLANEQTAGRGRFGRSWISPKGGLYATFIVHPDPLLSFKAGLAMVRILRSAGIDAGLKWPNDVFVGDLKIAGVLIETDGEYSLAGIGLNLSSAPQETATCVTHHAELPDRSDWVRAIAEQLIEGSSGGFDLADYRNVCLTLGRSVRIEGIGDDPAIEGIAIDVDDGGRLILKVKEGLKTVSSGECLHLRTAP